LVIETDINTQKLELVGE